MRKIIHKAFFGWELEKEEKWLNEMSAKGLALVDYSAFRYSFEECEPGEYSYKIQLLEHRPSHPESEQYIRFMEETGAEQVASYINWVYFRKKTAEGPFEIFSDIESKMNHLILIKRLFLPLGWINIAIGIFNLINMWISLRELVWFPFINIACAAFLFFGASKVSKEIRELRKEQAIRE